MAEVGFRQILINSILVGLFAFALITFLFVSMAQNNPSSQVFQDPSLNKTYYALNESLNSYQAIAEEQKNSTFSDNPVLGFVDIVLLSILGAGRILSTMVSGTFNTLSVFAMEIFHIPAIVLGVLSTVMIVSVIFLLWRMYKTAT